MVRVHTRAPNYHPNPAPVLRVNDESHYASRQIQAIRYSWQVTHLVFGNNGCQEDNEQNRQEY